jgi:dihydroorotate dehydrogenase (NAD+) catalytic subunit
MDIVNNDVTIIETDRPNIRAHDAGEDFHQRRFAGTVLSDHGHDLAGPDRKPHVAERLHAGIGFRDAVGFKEWHGPQSRPPHAARSLNLMGKYNQCMSTLRVTLGRLALDNPILVASGTFGYAKEMAGIVDFSKLGAIIPKTVTRHARIGNTPPRTVETASGMLNAIGLDNDGIDHFIAHHLPYLRTLPTAIIANIAGENEGDFVDMAAQIGRQAGLAGLELNLSCPNVAGGLDFATDPQLTRRIVQNIREVCPLPLIAKLTPNVTDIVPIAQAAADGGADAVSLVNTFVGMAVDWKRRRPILGNVTGGLSGPAIKPLALRLVWRVAQHVKVPIIGIGGIATIDDVMEFLVAGASAVQIGTANFYDPTASTRILAQLPEALAKLGAKTVSDIIGTLKI